MRNKLFGGLIALALFVSSLVTAATASTSFTSVSNGSQIFVKNLDSLTYSVSGTFVGTVVLERTRDNGLSWDYVLSAAAASSGTFKVETPAMEAAVYRFRCSAFTSGTIVTSIADTTADVTPAQEFKNVLGQVVGGIGESGLYGDFMGVTTNSSACTGCVGEILTGTNSSGTSMTTAITTNLTSVSLTPGDWEVTGTVALSGSATPTVSTLTIGAIATANNTLGTLHDGSRAAFLQNVGDQDTAMGIGPIRVSLAATTTYYLNARIDFSAGTATGRGRIRGRRIR